MKHWKLLMQVCILFTFLPLFHYHSFMQKHFDISAAEDDHKIVAKKKLLILNNFSFCLNVFQSNGFIKTLLNSPEHEVWGDLLRSQLYGIHCCCLFICSHFPAKYKKLSKLSLGWNSTKIVQILGWMIDCLLGVLHHFQQSFSYITAFPG